MDIWVDRTKENHVKLEKAFFHFGMPVFNMTLENYLNHPKWDVFTFGSPPVAIDIMVKVKNLNFYDPYEKSVLFTDEELSIRTMYKNHLTKAKKEAGSTKDENDLGIYKLKELSPYNPL